MAVKREKVVQTAEKYVQRGKINAAIREYRKLLEEFPDDATTLNRVGDLYARQDKIAEAIQLFTQIAENYTADGFFPKATAIYKKIIKLDPTRLEVYEQLAELYHRQGLLNEARTQYQVLGDYYLKHDNTTSATSIYERMTEVDPDDPSLRVKLADLYRQQQFLDKAMGQYRQIADLMLSHGHADEAEQVLLKALDVDASDVGFITDAVMKLKEGGQVAAAARFLTAAVERNPEAEKVARMVGVGDGVMEEAGAEAVEEAVEAAIEAEAAQGETAAESEAGVDAAAPELDGEEPAEEPVGAAEEVDEDELDTEPAMDAGDLKAAAAAAAEALDGSAEVEPTPAARAMEGTEGTEAGEITLDLDEFDVLGELDAELEDDGAVPDTMVQPPADLLDEEAAEPEVEEPTIEEPVLEEPELEEPEPDEAAGELDAEFLERTAAELDPEKIQHEEDLVTEAEVLLKYGLNEKAMERLGELMALNPEHTGGLALLVRMHLDEGQYEGAAELATELSQQAPRSEAWTALWPKLEASGFERSDDGGVTAPPAEEAAPAEESEEAADVEAADVEVADVEVADVEAEVDAALEEVGPAEEVEEPAEPVMEVELGPTVDITGHDELAAEETLEMAPEEAEPEEAEPEPAPAAPSRPAARRKSADVEDLLASLAAEVLPGRKRRKHRRPKPAAGTPAPPPTAEAPPPEAPPSETPPAEPAAEMPMAAEPGTEWLQEAASGDAAQADESLFSDEEDFFDLAAELEEELAEEGELDGDDLLLQQPREQSLEEIVEGFKQGVAESLSQEDHNTHFDLGIAYREMGLLDEAIGEFQVAAKSPALLVECCSMLGLCFLEKGLPELAVKWYRRGLEAPDLSEEDELGLQYDLGNAFQAMGEKEEAHRVFIDLYGNNSNYRDVVAKVEETKPR